MSKQRQRLNSSYRTREGFQQDVLPKVNHECIEVICQAEKGGRKLWTEKTIDALLRTMGYMQETTNNPLFLEKMGCMCMCSVAQWYPTLCDPMDCSPPGSSVHGVFLARIFEWVAISFSSAWKWKEKVKLLSHVQLLATAWTVAHQAPPSMGFSRQEYWSGVPLPSPRDGVGGL